jgi:hypothetical protein
LSERTAKRPRAPRERGVFFVPRGAGKEWVKSEETGFLVVGKRENYAFLQKNPGFWPPLRLNNYFINTL